MNLLSKLLKLLNILILFVTSLLLVVLLVKAVPLSGMYDTHDGTNHLVRFANYRIAIRELQIPPRWAPNLLNHYGYPVFLLNYPLLNLLSVPLSVAGLRYEQVFSLLTLLLFVVGGSGVVFWLRNFDKSFSNSSIWFSLVCYFSSAFLWNVVFVRGSIGELAAYSLFPWLLYNFEKVTTHPIKRRELIVAVLLYCAFLLSHNVSAVFGSALLLLWIGFSSGKKLRTYIKSGIVVIMGIGLAAWFWIPALVEANYTVIFEAANNKVASTHLVTIKQLIFAPLQFGYSYPGSIDSMSLMFGPLLLLALIGGSIGVLFKKHRALNRPLLLAFSLIFMQSTLSLGIWHFVVDLSIVQFPWRFSLFVTIFLLPAATWLWQIGNDRLRFLFLMIALLWMTYALNAVPQRLITRPDAFYETFPETTSTQHENMPKSFHYLEIGDWQPSPRVLSGRAEVSQIKWLGSARNYHLSVEEDAIIVEPTARFIGWQTSATNLSNRSTHILPYIDSEQIAGRIAYEISAGSYLIQTKTNEMTKARFAGDSITVVTVLLLIVFLQKRRAQFFSKLI